MSWCIAASLWISAYAAARRALPLRSDEAWLAAGLASTAELVLAAMLLGWAGMLTPAPLRIACFFLLSMNVFAACAARASARTLWSASLPWPLWPAAAALLGTVVFQLRLSSAMPVLSWDGLSYHMPIVYRWVSQGNLSLHSWFGPQRYFPWNGELLPAALAVLDGGNVSSAKIAQLLALPVMAASGALLGRLLAGRYWSAACALAFAALPIGLIHIGIPYVDLLYSSFWIAAASAAVSCGRGGRMPLLYLFGLGFGLALGTKATIYFQAPLLIPLCWALARVGRARRARALRHSPAILTCVLALGAFTYLRNWIALGNPFFPYTVRIGSLIHFQGITETEQLLVSVERWFVPSKIAWLWYPFRETLKGAVEYSSENGFGPLFAAGWALLPLSAWSFWTRRRWDGLAFLGMLPAIILFFFILHPTREPRYVIFLACVPIAGLAALLSLARGRWRIAALAGWSLGIIACCCGTLAAVGKDEALWMAYRDLKLTGRVDAQAHYSRQYGPLALAWAELNARLAAGDTVAANHSELLFPLYGMPPRGRVFIVQSRPVDYPDTLWAEAPEPWLHLLEDIKARFVFIWSPAWYPETGEKERRMLSAPKSPFRAIGDWASADLGRVSLYERR